MSVLCFVHCLERLNATFIHDFALMSLVVFQQLYIWRLHRFDFLENFTVSPNLFLNASRICVITFFFFWKKAIEPALTRFSCEQCVILPFENARPLIPQTMS